LKNYRLILYASFVLLFFASTIFAITPDWVSEFRASALSISRVSHGKSYQHPQPSLRILETKGKGNCVAWSKFMAKIAIAHKVEFDNYIVGRNIDGKKVGLVNHQITILKDSTNLLWLQSNANLMMIKDMKDALNKVVNEVDPKWTLGYRVIYKVTIQSQDLYK
jgi:hypothetical protein